MKEIEKAISETMRGIGGVKGLGSVSDLPQLSPQEKNLLCLFLLGRPYAISYEYRKKQGANALRNDLQILTSLRDKGLVRFQSRDSKTTTYVYTGPEPTIELTQYLRSK